MSAALSAGPSAGGGSPPPVATPSAPGGQPHAQIGQSPATGPVANAGQSAAGGQLMSVVSNLMVMALNQVGPASPEGQDLLKAINLVGKHVPPGSASPAQQMNQLRALMMRQVQMAPQVAQMQHQAASQMAAGQPMAGAPPQPQAA